MLAKRRIFLRSQDMPCWCEGTCKLRAYIRTCNEEERKVALRERDLEMGKANQSEYSVEVIRQGSILFY